MIQSVKSRRVSNFFPGDSNIGGQSGWISGSDRSTRQFRRRQALAFLRFTTNCIPGLNRERQAHSPANAPGSPDTPCSISLTSANVVKSTAAAANDRGHHGKRSNLLGEPCRCGNLRTADRAPQRHAEHTVRNRLFARAPAPLVPARRHRAQPGTTQLQVVGALRRLRTQGKRRRIRARQCGKRALGQANPTALDQAPSVLLRHDRRLSSGESRARARVRTLTARHTGTTSPTQPAPAPNAVSEIASRARKRPRSAGPRVVPLPGFEPGFPP
jgi:hypothetical protein